MHNIFFDQAISVIFFDQAHNIFFDQGISAIFFDQVHFIVENSQFFLIKLFFGDYFFQNLRADDFFSEKKKLQ